MFRVLKIKIYFLQYKKVIYVFIYKKKKINKYFINQLLLYTKINNCD